MVGATLIPTLIPTVTFVGRQNSGKTTLLVKLIAELAARGVRVGTVKHHSHAGFEFDVEGKDSWRHRQAGSLYTVIAAPDQMASVQTLDPNAEISLQQILEQMTAAGDTGGAKLDVILVEGYRRAGLPAIELFRAANSNDIDRALDDKNNLGRIIAVVTDIPRIAEEATIFGSGIPVFAFDDIDKLADFVLAFAADFAPEYRSGNRS